MTKKMNIVVYIDKNKLLYPTQTKKDYDYRVLQIYILLKILFKRKWSYTEFSKTYYGFTDERFRYKHLNKLHVYTQTQSYIVTIIKSGERANIS